jgi:hypothetical protein
MAKIRLGNCRFKDIDPRTYWALRRRGLVEIDPRPLNGELYLREIIQQNP